MFGFKKRRRADIKARVFPREWLAILSRRVPYYRCLTPADQLELQGHVQVFLDEKTFEGCGGLEMTDEIRVTVAGQACILLLHRETEYYPMLKSILVYPSRYFAPAKRPMGNAGLVLEGLDQRAGESWHRGSIVLSWSDVQAGAEQPCDGQNVVYHEFAHQIDGESGAVEGAPALESKSAYAGWAEVFSREYEGLIQDLRLRRPTLLGSYAATNPAEFFAVSTELFFERPWDLKAKHPELYEQMAEFFQQDPAARVTACAGPEGCGAWPKEARV